MPQAPDWPDDLRLPSLDALRALDTVARLGSFERAADSLHISASAVGKRIAALEEQLGTPLLLRGPRGLSPSPAGSDYLAQVRPALDLLATVPLHRRSQQRRQRLRLTAPPTFARLVLVPGLPEFEARHPALDLEIVLSIPLIDAAGPQADVVVQHGPAGSPGHLTLMNDVLLPLASPALLPGGALAQAADLADMPLLRTPTQPWAPWLAAAGLDWPEPQQGSRLVDLGLVLEAALAGQGVALTRPSLARQALRSGQLQPVLGRGATPLLAASTVYQLPPHATDAATQALADWVLACSRQAAAEGLALVSGGA